MSCHRPEIGFLKETRFLEPGIQDGAFYGGVLDESEDLWC
jgi:hypothetical protein